MLNRATVLFGAVALLSLATVRGDEPIKDQDAIKGTWTVIGHAHNGRVAPPENLKGMKFVIEKDSLVMDGPSGKTEYKVRLDGTTKPPSIDLIPTDPKSKGIFHPGVVKREKDQLTIALDMIAKDPMRPRDFEAPSGSTVMVWVLRLDRR
jgi:uncharacterized protein (TIGR03067 family)